MSKHRTTRRTHWVAFMLRAAIASVIALIVPATALAAEVRSGDTVTIGPNEVVTDDLYVFGNNLVIEGTVNSASSVVGSTSARSAGDSSGYSKRSPRSSAGKWARTTISRAPAARATRLA
jgi:hypothetical protein